MPNMSLKKNEMPSQEPNVRNKNFLEVALGYTEEQADVTQGRPYCLCVSSPGERALKTERDFERNLGACVTVELKSALKGKKKKFRGKLLSYGDKVIINTGKENVTFENENIASVSPYIGF